MKKSIVWLSEELVLPVLAMAVTFLPITIILVLGVIVTLVVIF